MHFTPAAPRRGQIVLGISLFVLTATLLFWLISAPKTTTAMVVLPNAQEGTGNKQYTAAEIMARFPLAKHEDFMRRAIANSRKAGVEFKTGGAFGAVIVTSDGEVISDGINHVVAENDPTWHAEVHAIRQACALTKSNKLHGCILYTSSAPCPLCLAASYWAGVDGIIYGATMDDSKKYGNFTDEFFYQQLSKPVSERAIPMQTLLRPEAVKVWKEYQQRTDKVDY